MRLGHGVGDRVLAETAGRLSECTRGADTVCRMGGDEFMVILENLHAAVAQPVRCRRGFFCKHVMPLEG